MADFNFFLNRQGPQGVQGPQGEEGFSPTIEVAVNTASEYKLRITTEDGTFITDNLRGSAVDDQGGTYMRFDPETQQMYAGNPDQATETSFGVVMIASDEDIEGGSEGVVVTADKLYDVNQTLSAHESTMTSLQTQITEISGDIPDVSNLATKSELSTEVSSRTLADANLQSQINNIVIPTVNDGTLTFTKGGSTLGTFSANTANNVTIDIPDGSSPNDGMLVIQKNGATVGTFSANSAANTTTNITVPTQLSDLSDGTTVVTQSTLATTLTDYVDNSTLTTTLTDYVETTDLSSVAFSGSYNDLSDKPTIPSQISITTTLNSQSTDQEVPGAATVYNALQNVSVSTATSSTPGIVQPDNNTITVDANGVISTINSGGAQIDDTTTTTTSTWSSTKINDEITTAVSSKTEVVIKRYTEAS